MAPHDNPHILANQTDRAAGVLLGTAAGDALGAGYEFGPPMPADAVVAMKGGGLGPFAPGEWTDDTDMAIAVAEAAAAGHDLRSDAGLDVVADGFRRWYAGRPKDIGIQTAAVLGAAGDPGAGGAAAMARAAAARFAERPDNSAGNGALMRTAAVALAHLTDPAAVVEAAQRVSELTHADPTSGEACAIWSLGIRHAVLHGSFAGVHEALAHLPAERAAFWQARLDEAEAEPPAAFPENGWVVHALQAAWSAIHSTPVPADDPDRGSFPAAHLTLALEAAVRAGGDTDTVAAIAGGLLGARWGASAVPARWRRKLHGWPGLRARDLVGLGVHAARRALGHAPDDGQGWPTGPTIDYSTWRGTDACVAHPHDPGVLVGGIDALRHLPAGVDAVVSLCRLGANEVPATGIDPDDHVEVWLIDHADRDANPNLGFVIDDAARAVADLRAEGRTVLLHCVAAQSRTPTVAARYAALAHGVPVDAALRDLRAALPGADPNSGFLELLAGGRAG